MIRLEFDVTNVIRSSVVGSTTSWCPMGTCRTWVTVYVNLPAPSTTLILAPACNESIAPNGAPKVTLRPAMTEFPTEPGSADPGISPGPFIRSAALVPWTTTWSPPIAGICSTATALPSCGR